MASKGLRSKFDHESRTKRQKVLEASKEPRRPKTHWDHVLEEMVWLSKDFESERKWKLAQAKKVALRASKGMLDQATRGEKKMKEEEHKLRKVALNISKDVKKFWLKIEKLVLYKHQMEVDEKKKKALDKQLEFLLGQTERYSTMLAENLVDNYKSVQQYPTQSQLGIQHKDLENPYPSQDRPRIQHEEADESDAGECKESNVDERDIDEDYDIRSDDESEDDEHTIEEDEVFITRVERQEELAALHDEMDLPLEELLKRYSYTGGKESQPDAADIEQDYDIQSDDGSEDDKHNIEENKAVVTKEEGQEESATLLDEMDDPVRKGEGFDDDYDIKSTDESKNNKHTIEENEAFITKEERKDESDDLHDEMDLPLQVLLKRYARDKDSMKNSPVVDRVKWIEEDHGVHGAAENIELPIASSAEKNNSVLFTGRRCGESNGGFSVLENPLLLIDTCKDKNLPTGKSDKTLFYSDDEENDSDFVLTTTEEKDNEATLSEEEELSKADSKNHPVDEIGLLREESSLPIEELLARYRKDSDNNEVAKEGFGSASTLSEGIAESTSLENIEEKQQLVSMDVNAESCELQSDVHSLVEEHNLEDHAISEGEKDSDNIIADAAAAARSAQPTGNTFLTTKVRTKFPFLVKYPLREYQHIGLDWLVTMYEKRLNGILADEMGLGKTIMTIALLAHLACEKGIWGPHLIVVPTSVMLNWETEFLKWCPAFKILTYFGSAKERKLKRQGWLKPNSFHVCITTYRLVIQDSKVFKRKKWKYLILDEAHLIKNWKSQRWQTLLNFNSKRRILLTGTPLQNDLMELWSLMHFLMPHVFQSHQEFKDWFSNPITGMVEGQEKVNKEVVDRLHNVLRPFLLRRLKRDVETQLPMKHEHVIYCRLSRRQRNLYEDFIASSETQATLASTNFFGMISIIMQLRKVCNHPDLFEGRPIVSSFDMGGIDIQFCSSLCSIIPPDPFSRIDLKGMGFLFSDLDYTMTSWETDEVKALATPSSLIKERADLVTLEEIGAGFKYKKKLHGTNIFEEIRKAILEERLRQAKQRAAAIAWWNSLKCEKKPIYSTTLRELVTVKHTVHDIHKHKVNPLTYMYSSKLADIVLSPVERFQKMIDIVESFMFAIPAARAPAPVCWCSKPGSSSFLHPSYKQKCSNILSPLLSPFRPAIVRRQVYFPDRRLIQFDCGKLQELAILLRKLKSEGHRALIFTQMTKMLDVLEAFINLYGYTYVRLDGSTQPEERQTLMQRFNTNPKIFLFILSTRSGGVGINLVGADTVIFYDSDWNPAMDQQAQDRCHRIGQTREVHIYRLISESTIEENILKKANQKRALDDLVIQSGGYNTEFFKKLDPIELFSGHRSLTIKMQKEKNYNGKEVSVSKDDLEAALKHAEDEADYMALKKVEQEEAVENQEFTEEAIGRLEDDELVNENDVKVHEPVVQDGIIISGNKENAIVLHGHESNEEKALTVVAGKEDDGDMLADIKEMAAAAAAAGQTISSFENQLRPIDRYAIRFLELWDPIIDKAAVESQDRFEEMEWELDRIEKYKDEMEAEIDEDEEPLVYEEWDADLATEAYRQQVEALAHHQLMEELECEANEKENEEDENCDSKNETPCDPRPKSKKKAKKGKFKSLKKRSLASELKTVKHEPPNDDLSLDKETNSQEVLSGSDMASSHSSVLKKRKKVENAHGGEYEKISKKKSKKLKKAIEISPLDLDTDLTSMQNDEPTESRPCENVVDFDHKPINRTKTGGKIFITSMPIKRVLLIKPEKLKKGNIWSRDYIPAPDFWLPQEDAVLCAVVHEYGPHWSLVSETLYGMTAGGFYRGRYRHPAHCCERYRELIQRYILSAPENHNYEKASNAGSGKALFKVTEENLRMLLDVAAEHPNRELLLQKHFTALLSSFWKMMSRTGDQRNHSSSRNGLYFGGRLLTSVNQISHSSIKEPSEKMGFAKLGQSSRLLADALQDADSMPDNRVSLPRHHEETRVDVERLEVTLEFGKEVDGFLDPFPSVINLSVTGSDRLPSLSQDAEEDIHLRGTRDVAENRFRSAARACVEDSLGWASSVFPTNDTKTRSTSKLPTLGKHKLSSDLTRPTKSKSKKTSVEHGEMLQSIGGPMFQPLQIAVPMEPDLDFNLTSSISKEVLENNYELDMDKELFSEMMDGEVATHSYVPGLISGLDDCSSWPEFSDIG